LQGSWREATLVSFPTEFFSQSVDVENGKVYGNLVLNSTGSGSLNPRWIGVSPVGTNDVSLSASPATVRPGETVMVTVGGDGFNHATTFEVMNPAFRRTSDFVRSTNYVQATYALDSSASPTSAVVVVHKGSEKAMLTGALRVQKANGGGRSRSAGK
jgi:hypothetical protein